MNRQIQHLTEAVRIDMGVGAVCNAVQGFGVFQSKDEIQNERRFNRYIDKIIKRKTRRSGTVAQTVTQVDDFSLNRRSFSIE